MPNTYDPINKKITIENSGGGRSKINKIVINRDIEHGRNMTADITFKPPIFPFNRFLNVIESATVPMANFPTYLNNNKFRLPEDVIAAIQIAIPGLTRDDNGVFSYSRELDNRDVSTPAHLEQLEREFEKIEEGSQQQVVLGALDALGAMGGAIAHTVEREIAAGNIQVQTPTKSPTNTTPRGHGRASGL